jgi:outer membrane lipoprotein-sorting protein
LYHKVNAYARGSTLVLLGALVAASPSPAPSGLPDAATVLQNSEARWAGLKSYEVPVTINGSVRVAIISLPVKMTGTQYYQSPDEQALHLDNPPRLAQNLGETLSGMGTPQTWLQDYTIGPTVTQPHGRHTAYVLTGVPKRESRVKNVTLWISSTTYAIESMTFSYTNGASLVVSYQRHPGVSQYHLPRSATVVAKFPGYSGTAHIAYGAYQFNQPIPASVFAPH